MISQLTILIFDIWVKVITWRSLNMSCIYKDPILGIHMDLQAQFVIALEVCMHCQNDFAGFQIHSGSAQ